MAKKESTGQRLKKAKKKGKQKKRPNKHESIKKYVGQGR